ncbi:MAG: endonuclease/exonuclease/phosphatase family protein [Candidatus Liptonbacteria bacterium]|nr:endonuclease/exonuclease/phosphatase family protein [Candidatus Liptonbacteria bacterium]
MKLISLNAFGGKAYAPLMEFVKEHAPTTDIFCLQEIFSSPSPVHESHGARMNLFEELGAALPDFQGLLASEQDGWDFQGPVGFPVSMGNALFVRRTFPIASSGNFFVYLAKNKVIDNQHFPQSVIYTRLEIRGARLTVANFHGIPQPGHKLDTPERLAQSQRICEFLAREPGAKILCGDFNLLPGTQSLALVEKDMRNLITEFSIERTRSRLSPFFGKPDFQPFADYIFTSPRIHATRLEAPDVQISDHLPLVLEFS